MKRILILGVIMTLIDFWMLSELIAQTISVGGEYPGTATWGADTVKVTSDVRADSLIILPGTYIEFQGNYRLKAEWYFEAQGTEEARIVFTVHDTTGFHDLNCCDGGWRGIKCRNRDTLKVSWVTFSYGKSLDENLLDFGRMNNISVMKHCTIKHNVSANHLISFDNGVGNLQYTYIKNNKIKRSIFSGGDGEAYITLNINNLTLKDNVCENIISTSDIGNIEFTGSTIIDNTFQSFISYMPFDTYYIHITFEECNIKYNSGEFKLPSVTMKNCDFTNNISRLYCVAEYGNDCMIENNLFESNQGGFEFREIHNMVNVKLFNNKFINNSADSGIIQLGKEELDEYIINNLFDGNVAYRGGALHLHGNSASSMICNNTFVNNRAKFGGAISFTMFYDYYYHYLVNNIFYNNTADSSLQLYASCNPNISVFNPYNMKMYNNLIEDYDELISLLSADAIDEDNFNGNPFFNYDLTGDYVLAGNSSCINAGTLSLVGSMLNMKDLLGKPRVIFDTIDIGAYEYASAPYVTINPENLQFCEGDSICIKANARYYVKNIWFKDGQYFSNGNDLTLNNLKTENSGEYFVRYYNEFDSTDSDVLELSVKEIPDFKLIADPGIISSTAITISPDKLYSNKEWSDGSIEDNLIVDELWGIGKHEVWLKMSNENGCESADTIEVELVTPDELYSLTNDFSFKISPNPFSEQALISLPDFKGEAELFIVNLSGEIVYQDIITDATYELRNYNFEPGTYTLIINVNNKQHTTKAVIY